MAELSALQAKAAEGRAASGTAEDGARKAQFRSEALVREIAEAERLGEAGALAVRKLKAEKKKVDAALGKAQQGLEATRKGLDGIIAEIAALTPEEVAKGLDDATRIVFLPVRIETKTALIDRRTILRVRVFPDDVMAASHEAALTAAEIEDGQIFWREAAKARALADPTARDEALQGAFARLSDLHGGPRSVWILRQTRPTNYDDTPAPAPDALVFPDLDVDKPPGFTAPPRVRLMPDRFVIVCYRGGQIVHQAQGRPIPDDILLGPDPLQLEGSIKRAADGTLAADPRLAWLFEYEAAVAAGLGVTIGLTPADVAEGFERILAVGFKASAAPAEAVSLLSGLFEAHAYGRGIDVLPQGTPTNNTSDAPSGFTSDYRSAAALFDTAVAGAVVAEIADATEKSDGQRLAETLGLPFASVQSWPEAGRQDIAEALTMNRALLDATLGGFLREWLSPLVTREARLQIERFFLRHVTGRGLAPAFRVGRQPYGIVLTSALDRWRWARGELPRDDAIVERLTQILLTLRKAAAEAFANVARVGAQDSDTAALMKTLGLQASSVEWHSRKAVSDRVSWSWLVFNQSLPASWRRRIWEAIQRRKRARLERAGLDLETIRFDDLTFLGRTDDLASAPVVDGDPVVPLSETAGIRPFEGDRTYIDWLATASHADIAAGRFSLAAGGVAPAPKALLYKYLRHAALERVEEASELLFRARAQVALPPDFGAWSIRSIGVQEAVRSDLVAVDAAKIGLATAARPLGDYALDVARVKSPFFPRPPEVVSVADGIDALTRLADLPTARLERLFAEHMDLVSYRLDAWLTGLIATRFEGLRARTEAPGIHLAAYGIVENFSVRRDRLRPISPDGLPDGLLPDGATLARDPANAGYVLAPSLTHGVSAAVLLNAHLTTARSDRAETMAIDLSSARVRAAMALIEGLRNGQELGALLGYSLERDLHDAGGSGVELDAMISVLRERFPFTSKRLADVPDGEPAEAIEARNVVDGYGLIVALRERPALQTELEALAGAGASVLRAAIETIRSALDALGDLFMAESLHQVVQGNMERARGTIQAVTEGDIPPVPEIVSTPRSGRLLVERIALHLPAGGAAWTAPPTPRAAMEPRLDTWIAGLLPAPGQIGAVATDAAGTDHPVSMADLDLCALDLVLDSGDRIGEGASDIERLLVDAARRLHAMPDDAKVVFRAPGMPGAPPGSWVIDTGAAPPGDVALAAIHPMLTALRRLIGRCRPLSAEDWRPASRVKDADPVNPRGFVVAGDPPLPAELDTRVAAAKTAFDTAVQALATALTAMPAADIETLRLRETAFDSALPADQAIVAAWTPRLADLGARLRALVPFGLPEALPAVTALAGPQSIVRLFDQAAALVAIGAKRAAAHTVATAPPPAPGTSDAERKAFLQGRVEAAVAAARAVLGAAMPVLPLFRLPAADRPEASAALAAPAETDPLAIEGWLQPLARVRENVTLLARVTASAEMLGQPEPTLVPIQLPFQAGAPWAATTLNAQSPPGEILSIVTIDPPSDLSADLAGLLIDEWTELVPGETENLGIAFQYDRPNAAAPQALLVAVSPVLEGHWTWDKVLAVLNDTFARARERAVEPDLIQAIDAAALVPMTLVPFTTGRFGLSTLLATAASGVALPVARDG